MIDFIIVLFLVWVLITAVKCEILSSNDSFHESKYRKGDSKKKIIKKIQGLIKSEKISVKWRKIYIATVVVLILLFFQGKYKFEDTIIFLVSIYIVFYLCLQYTSQRDCNNKLEYFSKLESGLMNCI